MGFRIINQLIENDFEGNENVNLRKGWISDSKSDNSPILGLVAPELPDVDGNPDWSISILVESRL